MSGDAVVVRGDALALPLPDRFVDLIVTSPPYFGLRSYQDDGVHYDGQIGDEATPVEFVDALIAATREMVRVLKPSGSIWVNLGDKYMSRQFGYGDTDGGSWAKIHGETGDTRTNGTIRPDRIRGEGVSRSGIMSAASGVPRKSLIGVPWRYAIRCIDDLGLILRAEVIWSKPNSLPESVTDRVRRSHETWFHFTKEPRYFSAVDEIREATTRGGMTWAERLARGDATRQGEQSGTFGDGMAPNPLGKLPGSVWTIPTEPLTVPDHLGVDHFAAFPTEWPRRIIQGWSPTGICTVCGEGRRPVTEQVEREPRGSLGDKARARTTTATGTVGISTLGYPAATAERAVIGYVCACPTPDAATTPSVIVDPFGGTGTTALVAKVLGRVGVSVDLSGDYCRLTEWRIHDPGQVAKAMRVDKPAPVVDGQLDLLGGV